MATSVVGSDELARRQAQNVGEALRNEPGLSVNSDSAQGQNPVIRGLKRDSIVLLVDGMRFNSAQPMGAVASFMSLGLADRVEVVKGPSSVLYGTGALGGVIDVQLPQARFRPGLQARGTVGFDSASRGWNGAAGLNASTGDHALMLGASLALRPPPIPPRPTDFAWPYGFSVGPREKCPARWGVSAGRGAGGHRPVPLPH